MHMVKSKKYWGPLDNQTWQTEWKTAPLAKVQLYEHENKTLGADFEMQFILNEV